jgi:transposase-like protein
MSPTNGDVRRGRPVKGSALVDGLPGSESAKLRLKLVIDSLSGKISVEEACRQLGIGESRFHAMRQEVLAGALSGLEPSPAGRPAKERPEDDPERETLRKELLQARLELQAARVREQIAIAMPGVLQSRKHELLKKTSPRPGRGPDKREGK